VKGSSQRGMGEGKREQGRTVLVASEQWQLDAVRKLWCYGPAGSLRQLWSKRRSHTRTCALWLLRIWRALFGMDAPSNEVWARVVRVCEYVRVHE
jgi:hypothetical protein